ncbi:hypothetical protein Franean1_0008 [Parafrankia sp. EAN1pec]|nr:hypothetical protein Franean1_0008 [Frankia sp. EAN1pec]
MSDSQNDRPARSAVHRASPARPEQRTAAVAGGAPVGGTAAGRAAAGGTAAGGASVAGSSRSGTAKAGPVGAAPGVGSGAGSGTGIGKGVPGTTGSGTGVSSAAGGGVGGPRSTPGKDDGESKRAFLPGTGRPADGRPGTDGRPADGRSGEGRPAAGGGAGSGSRGPSRPSSGSASPGKGAPGSASPGTSGSASPARGAGASGAGAGGAASPFFQRPGRDENDPSDRDGAGGQTSQTTRLGVGGTAEPKLLSASATVPGSSSAGTGGGTDRAAPAPRGGDSDPDETSRQPAGRQPARDADAARPAGDGRKPTEATRGAGAGTSKDAAPAAGKGASRTGTRADAARPDAARPDTSRAETTRKPDAQTTVRSPAARPGTPVDPPRDSDTISLVRPNLPKRGSKPPADRVGADVKTSPDRGAVTDRMPAERRPTPEPVRAATPSTRQAPLAGRTAPYDRPGTPPGPLPTSGGVGPNGLSTEPFDRVDDADHGRPGGAPGPQGGPPRGQQQPGGREPGRDTAGQGPRRGPAGGRRARLRVSRVEPLSVTRLSFAFSLCVFLIMIVAVAVLWFVLNSIGVFDSVTKAADTLTDGTNANVSGWLSFGRAMQVTLLVGAINVVLMTALATLGALLYNLCADMIGGLEVTLSDQ